MRAAFLDFPRGGRDMPASTDDRRIPSCGYEPAMPHTTAGRLIVAGRLLFGVAFFGAPRASMATVGLHPADNPQAAHWARIFGVRDAALGLGLIASTGDARRLWWRLGMVCDAGDAVAGVLSWRNGELPRRRSTLLLFTGSALAGVGLGAAALAAGDA
jgi:uncharacterized protein DUF4267